MFREQQRSVGELTLNYAEGPPSGRPLVLLHGVIRCWQDYLALLPALATRFHVHVLDFRGHGKSERAKNGYLVTDYVRDAADFVAGAFSEPVVIYGHSLGAMVAAAVAAELPDRVRGLVLEDPPFDTMGVRIRQTPFHSYFAALFELVQRQLPVADLAGELADLQVQSSDGKSLVRLGTLRDPVALRFIAHCCSQLDPEVLRPIVAEAWLTGYERDELLRKIDCPTLLLQGDCSAGGMLADADASQVAALISDCLHIKLPGVGHLIHSQQTEATLRYLLPFVESLPSVSRRDSLTSQQDRKSLV